MTLNTTVLTGQSPYSYLWINNNPIIASNTGGANSLLTGIKDGIVGLQYSIMDANGCKSLVSTLFNVTITPAVVKFEIPNAFIPNDPNGSNKILKASYNSAVQSVVFKVFNRMGQLVYEVNNQPPYSIQWDGGIAAGKLQEPDGYVWFAELTVLVAGGSKIEHKKGQFLLLK